MIASRLLALVVIAMPGALPAAVPLPVVTRDGQDYVASVALERDAGIVLKRLPGRDAGGGFVACGGSQCGPLNGVLIDNAQRLAPVAELSKALNLTATFDDGRRHVIFGPAPPGSFSATGSARVGNLAPNLRLTKLDGTTLTLDELRGQRVLINSWASW